MIYDGFPFFNEVDLLELRLEVMNECVDRFIIVESRRTFTNIEKELYFEKNKERYAEYLDKIEYVVIDEFPDDCKSAWDREHFQRNAIFRGIKNPSPDDILLVSDLDEILNPYGVNRAKKLLGANPDVIYRFELINCWYYLNYVDQKEFFWSGPVGYTVGELLKYHEEQTDSDEKGRLLPQAARGVKNEPKIACAGWHFTYMGGIESIKNKVRSFSHQEYNTAEWLDDDRIIDMIKSGKDLFDRGISDFVSIPVGSVLPRQVRQNAEKYKDLICEYRPMSRKTYARLKFKYFCETTPLRGIYHVLGRIKHRRHK